MIELRVPFLLWIAEAQTLLPKAMFVLTPVCLLDGQIPPCPHSNQQEFPVICNNSPHQQIEINELMNE